MLLVLRYPPTTPLLRFADGPSGLEYTPVDCYVAKSHIRIVCFTAIGVGKNLALRITVGGQTREPSLSSGADPATQISYAAPRLEHISVIPFPIGPLSKMRSELAEIDDALMLNGNDVELLRRKKKKADMILRFTVSFAS